MVTANQTESPIDFARMVSSPQYAALTEQQRTWVTQFLATGSAFSATKTAYHTKSDANARVLSYEIAKNFRILAALDVAAGKVRPVKSERERLAAKEERQRKQLIATVRKQLAAAEEGSVAAQKLLAQLERLVIGIKMGRPENDDQEEPETDSAKSASSTKFVVGQFVTQRDDQGVLHTGKIIAVDAEGRATKIEEVK